MSAKRPAPGSINSVWFRVLFFGSIVAGAAVSVPILWLGAGMPLALLAAVPFIVLARFAWSRACWRTELDTSPGHSDRGCRTGA